ncbi:MAG: serpin family protein [Gemmatimonadales bacterium]|nr:MAG: serpin family protein [Gemmatimonadales bacterium]
MERATPGLAVLLLLAAGCGLGTEPGDRPDGPGPLITELPRSLTPAESAAIEAGNRFAFDLLDEVLVDARDESVFLSPFSAFMALGMTMNGARGTTFDAMRATLRFDGMELDEINEAYAELLGLLENVDPQVEFAVGNAVWHRAGVPVRESFRDRVEEGFRARVEGLDFESPAAAQTMNAWARDVTRDRIDGIVDPPIPSNVMAYLMNATYFKAGWREPFDPDLTRTDDFHLPDGSTASAEFMVRDDTVGFYQGDGWRAVDLPYAGGAWSMTVVVPEGSRTVQDLIGELDAEGWDALVDGLETGRVMVQLPRFELEWEGVLNDPLVRLGMGPAFGGGADFSGMFEEAGAWIDEVKQKSFVRVDEEGTEAAAVTSVVMVTSMPPEVRADRPFLFALRERLSGTILFMGVIQEPPTL